MGYGTIDSRGLEVFDKVKVGHIDLGARLHLADGRRRWVPYGDLALTFWRVTDVLKNGEWTSTDFTSRPTVSVGGGLAIYLSEAWALDVNLKAGKGRFKDVPVDDIPTGGTSGHPGTLLDLDAASIRLGGRCLVVVVTSESQRAGSIAGSARAISSGTCPPPTVSSAG